MANALKKITVTASVAAAVVGVMAATATAASASEGNDQKNVTQIGNASKQQIGNTTSHGDMSPNFALVNGGVLNCVDIQKVTAQVPVGAAGGLGLGIQDILNSQANQTCTQESVQQTGDGPLSHILTDVIQAN
jgi:hypothetical protein